MLHYDHIIVGEAKYHKVDNVHIIVGGVKFQVSCISMGQRAECVILAICHETGGCGVCESFSDKRKALTGQ